MPSFQPHVFVSSIMEGYQEFREAARRGIEKSGGVAILAEDRPAQPDSPRNTCLDLVAQCNAVLSIIGPRGGHRAPSGRLVVEEEFEEATRRALPVLVFLQETPRDSDAELLASKFSDWVGGRYRQTFGTAPELEEQVFKGLAPLLRTIGRPDRDPRLVQIATEDPRHGGGQWDAIARFCLAPTVADEIIDPLDLDTVEMRKTIQRCAHDCELFQYEAGKEVSSEPESLAIEQRDSTTGSRLFARIAFTTSGLFVLEKQVTGHAGKAPLEGFLSAGFEIVASDLEGSLAAMFCVAKTVLEKIDPHVRYPIWMYNAAIVNPGMRRIVETPAKSHQACAFDDTKVVTAFDTPRPVTRGGLSQPGDEIRRTVRMLRKRLGAERRP